MAVPSPKLHPDTTARQRSTFEGRRMLVCYLRAARRKARVAAEHEVVGLLDGLDATVEKGGPLSERGGVCWISLPAEHLQSARARLPRLGYSEAIDAVIPEEETGAYPDGEFVGVTRWRRAPYRLLRLYQEDPVAMRERAPDRRVFLFETGDGKVREIRGYRGSEDPLTHRALPVADARLLVNLVTPAGPGVLLDPFAGAGGIVLEAVPADWKVLSADIDPAVRHGLAAYGATHLVADARRLPLRDETVDAVATEPPYDPSVGTLAADALGEAVRVLRSGGRIALLCAAWQADTVRASAASAGLEPLLDTPVNRKGLDVVVLTFQK